MPPRGQDGSSVGLPLIRGPAFNLAGAYVKTAVRVASACTLLPVPRTPTFHVPDFVSGMDLTSGSSSTLQFEPVEGWQVPAVTASNSILLSTPSGSSTTTNGLPDGGVPGPWTL